ncbi:MAG: hypothetical protein ACRD8A_01055 [Candidatus Acidiferrales bacterium]
MKGIGRLAFLPAVAALIPGLSRQALKSQHSAELSKAKIVVGVLEDVPGHYAGQSDFRAVRAIFEKVGNEWKPFPNDCRSVNCLATVTGSYPAHVTWTIAFNGRNVGRVETRVPKSFKFYSSIGLDNVVSTNSVPTIGKRSMEYGGFLSTPVYRPLVAVSQPNFLDPQEWKTTALPPEAAISLRYEFRKRFPKVSNCKNPDEDSLRPWPYSDADIRFGKTYRSNDNEILSSVLLDSWRCDGPSDDGSAFDLQWYLVNPRGEIRFIGSGMRLLDAGDYDAEGRSELVFVVDGYDLGGYELFYDDFRKRAVFNFSYH